MNKVNNFFDYFINSPSNRIPESETVSLMATSNPLHFHQSINNYQPTPLVELTHLAKKNGLRNIYLKDESHRFGLGAFKGLGASYAIHEILKRKPEVSTFCTATDGNHGRAVAWAAAAAGKKAVVYVPQMTTTNRMEAIRKEGADVIQLNKNYDETCAYAEQQSVQNGWQLVQDTAWENYEEIPALIMAGYLTMYQELEKSLHVSNDPMVDIIFLQAGVGSWAASAIWYYHHRYRSSRPKLVIVEPAESDGIFASFNASKRVKPTGTGETIMAGLNCGIPSSTAWPIIQNGCDAAMCVTDEDAREAMCQLYYPMENGAQVIAGESGVGGLAGCLALLAQKEFSALKDHLKIGNQTRVLCFNTEGATDRDSFHRAIQRK